MRLLSTRPTTASPRGRSCASCASGTCTTTACGRETSASTKRRWSTWSGWGSNACSRWTSPAPPPIRWASWLPAEKKQELRKFLETHSDRVCGLIPIDPSDPLGSCQKIDEWVANGPCVGIKYYGGNPGGVRCSHADNDVIIRQAAKLNALIYIHAWYQMGGEPRRPGGANLAGESTPEDVALLARRFPDVPLICGHSGGDWELGVRAVRQFRNVYLEFSGSDPHSGQVDFTVAEVGADRLVWGGHGPSRSYSTELAKVFDADLTLAQREQIFGGNLRRLAEPIFRKKGYKL